MNKLIKTILLILLGNVMVAQNLQISLEILSNAGNQGNRSGSEYSNT